jgi:hypothetical protein
MSDVTSHPQWPVTVDEHGHTHRSARDLMLSDVKTGGGLEPIPGYEDYKRGMCTSPMHAPPTHICVPEGMRYRHVCSACGKESFVYPPTLVTFCTFEHRGPLPTEGEG